MRDGFQIEPKFIPTEQKDALINRLSRTGLARRMEIILRHEYPSVGRVK